ncbi:uncharacterized protein LOC131189221 isoform X2 [Ahaetulla prasina]|uniref:uncharacterized protein LOC131189221 isoform X2 n=1 Tax=Ahaetulla prasina TaxID=499056 RepID=UPI0026480F93|nr:uncharacterized protein LOC131189221 isoform X2 [Ahaetulla prasina]
MADSASHQSRKRGLSSKESPESSHSSKRSKSSRHQTSKSRQSVPAQDKDALKRHKAIEKAIEKAVRLSALQEASPQQTISVATAQPSTSAIQSPGVPITEQDAPLSLSPDRESLSLAKAGGINERLFGMAPQEVSSDIPSQLPLPQQGISVGGEETADPRGSKKEPIIAPEIANMIEAAIQKSLATEWQRRTETWVSQCNSASECQSQLTLDQARSGAQVLTGAPPSQASSGVEDVRDLDLSEDEDLSPDQPSFVGLFKPQLFRSLLHKARVSTGLAAPVTSDSVSKPSQSSIPLFEEPALEPEEIPGPRLFQDVLIRQWNVPASGPNPSALDRRLFNLAPEVSKLLQIPVVDSPVAALVSPSVTAGPPEENLKPEDKRSEYSLVKTHQAVAWSVKSSLAASFFNRAALLWIKQLQERLPSSDVRSHQDINKIVASLEYSADSTMHASCFAAKAIGSTVASRRLLWLRHWQADAKNKWRLASAPFQGDKLFGNSLEPLLIETKDKRRVLPSLSRRSEFRPSASSSFRSFRGSGQGPSGNRPQRYFPSRQGRSQDRSGNPSQRGPSKRPFRGGRGRPFHRYR